MTLKTVAQYAALCGITPQSVRCRLRTGAIKKAVHNNKYTGTLIDVDLYPPVTALKRGRKAFEG